MSHIIEKTNTFSEYFIWFTNKTVIGVSQYCVRQSINASNGGFIDNFNKIYSTLFNIDPDLIMFTCVCFFFFFLNTPNQK